MFHNSNVFGSCIIHILYINSTNLGKEYFKHGIYSPFFSLQSAVCFLILTYLVPVLFTFYIQSVLKLKKNNSGAKRLTVQVAQDLKLSEIEIVYLSVQRGEYSFLLACTASSRCESEYSPTTSHLSQAIRAGRF